MSRRALVIVTLAGAASVLDGCHRRRHPVSDLVPSSGTSNVAAPVANVEPAGTCAAPCCGGSACVVSAANVGRGGCNPAVATCSACSSGLSCVPGTCTSMLGAGETWTLHVSYVAGGDVPNMCASSRRNIWACLRRSSSSASVAAGGWVCLPMDEACTHGAGRGTSGVHLTTNDLTTIGVDLELRDGGPIGRVLAEKLGARYLSGLLRQALCTGLKFDHLRDVSGDGISTFAFFLDPP